MGIEYRLCKTTQCPVLASFQLSEAANTSAIGRLVWAPCLLSWHGFPCPVPGEPDDVAKTARVKEKKEGQPEKRPVPLGHVSQLGIWPPESHRVSSPLRPRKMKSWFSKVLFPVLPFPVPFQCLFSAISSAF